MNDKKKWRAWLWRNFQFKVIISEWRQKNLTVYQYRNLSVSWFQSFIYLWLNCRHFTTFLLDLWPTSISGVVFKSLPPSQPSAQREVLWNTELIPPESLLPVYNVPYRNLSRGDRGVHRLRHNTCWTVSFARARQDCTGSSSAPLGCLTDTEWTRTDFDLKMMKFLPKLLLLVLLAFPATLLIKGESLIWLLTAGRKRRRI